jgi:hypothetical protein
MFKSLMVFTPMMSFANSGLDDRPNVVRIVAHLEIFSVRKDALRIWKTFLFTESSRRKLPEFLGGMPKLANLKHSDFTHGLQLCCQIFWPAEARITSLSGKFCENLPFFVRISKNGHIPEWSKNRKS